MLNSIVPIFSSATAAASYQNVVLSDNPLTFWMMNETSGTTATDLGSAAINGTYVDTPTLNVSTSLIGLPKGVTFDGIGEYLKTDNQSAYNLAPNGNWSHECWFKTTTTGVCSISAVRNHGASEGGTILSAFFTNVTTNKVSLYVTDSAGTGYVTLTSSTSINTGSYFHICATAVSGGALKLYINGVEEASTTSSRSSSTQSRDFVVAAQPAQTGVWQNPIAETAMAAALYNTTLSSTRVLAHYNAGI